MQNKPTMDSRPPSARANGQDDRRSPAHLPRVVALPRISWTIRVATLALIFLAVFAARALAADVPPPPDQDAAAWLKALYAAFTSKSWGVLVGLVLIAAVYPLRRFGPDVLKSKLGGVVLAFLMSLAATLGVALAAGAAISFSLAADALATAAAAAGVWEWLKDSLPGVQTAAVKASSSPAGT